MDGSRWISRFFFAGMTMGLSLIVAIGAQNAFVLRQGLRDEHVFAVCLTCAVSDALLILLGVTSFARIAAWLPWLDPVMRYGGAAFLVWYGAKSLRSALRSTEALTAGGTAEGERPFQDAAGLPGDHLAEPARLSRHGRPAGHGLDPVSRRAEISFATGAIAGSFLFFFSLGYGAAWLRPVFARPSAWRVLEGAIALVMWAIALKLITGA